MGVYLCTGLRLSVNMKRFFFFFFNIYAVLLHQPRLIVISRDVKRNVPYGIRISEVVLRRAIR